MKTLKKIVLFVTAGIAVSTLAGCYETDYYVNQYPATPPVTVSDYPASGAHYGPPVPPPMQPSGAYYGPPPLAPQQMPPSVAHYGPPAPQPMPPQSSAHYGAPTPPPTPPVAETYGSSSAHYGPAAQQVPVVAQAPAAPVMQPRPTVVQPVIMSAKPATQGVIAVEKTSDMKRDISVEKTPVVMTDKSIVNTAKARDLPDLK